jgi:hypothetical protein
MYERYLYVKIGNMALMRNYEFTSDKLQKVLLVLCMHVCRYVYIRSKVGGPFAKFVDWRQCAAVMQREAVTVMPSCSGEGTAVVA